MRLAPMLSLALLVAACGGAPPNTAPSPPSTSPLSGPSAAPSSAAPSGDPFAVRGELRDDARLLRDAAVVAMVAKPLPAAPEGVPPPPPACAAFLKRKPARAVTCQGDKDRAAALAGLDKALGESDAGKRDALLADLEACAAVPVGLARALRADLAPTECADALVEPVVAKPPKGMPPIVHHALFGQAVGARLARTAKNPPKLAPPYSKKRVQDFILGPVRDWVVEQAKAVQTISELGADLQHYGRGIAGMEASLAELRMIEASRAMPIPDEIARDPEARNVYFGELDQWLEPRKARGRSAALVGLKELAGIGVLRDGRVARARKLLSELYGGRRIDALDALLLPALAPVPTSSMEERLAARLPTFYAGLVLDPADASRPGVLRALLEQGLSVAHRIALRAADLAPDARLLHARARLEFARTYWSAVDVDRAIALCTSWPSRPEEATFLLALSLALRDGPEDATDLMRKALNEPLGVVQTAALDAVAGAPPPAPRFAGLAAFDAAYVRQLGAPRGADAAYWKNVATRFRAAAPLLGGAAERSRAEELARAADATAAAIKSP